MKNGVLDATDARILEAVADGASTLQELRRRTGFESIQHIRVRCGALVMAGYLMTTAQRRPNPFNLRWGNKPVVRTYWMTDAGQSAASAYCSLARREN